MGSYDKLQGEELTAALSAELKTFARQKWPLTTDEWRKDKLASMLRMGRRRVKSLYEGERSARPRFEEVEKIKALIGQGRPHDDAREDRALAARIAALEAQLAEVRALLAQDELADQGQWPREDRRNPSGHGRRSTDRR